MMKRKTQTGSNPGPGNPTPEPAKRKLESWIESFVERTASLHNPPIFRKWTAISAIAAALEQKVWIKTSRPLYPNLYIFLIGHPGVGKTRAIREGRHYILGLPEPHLAPISITWASLVDELTSKKRNIMIDGEMHQYNSMYICSDELGAFISEYKTEMTDGLSAFYDPDPYQQSRRTSNIHIKIESPQINLICGSTPQNLTDLMPEKAWGQGFSSRIIMVFSDERILGDDFAATEEIHSEDLMDDMQIINGLYGQFQVTEEYRAAVNLWRQQGEPPVPNHPKLIHYVTRRRAHLYKLSMVSAIDRSNALILTRDDFNRAMGWLLEAEETMPDIFKAGATNADAQAMDEIHHYIKISDRGQGVSEQKITRFAMERIPLHSVLRVIDIMERSGQIHLRGIDRSTKMRYFTTEVPELQ